MSLRIGMGYDVHQLAENYELWIGGIKIPSEKGSVGHSDGDVLIHAICDALFGALNLRDIGFHFPDTDPELKGIDSKILLKKTIQIIREKGYELGNLDSTVCLQYPKLNPHIPKMQETLAEVMSVDVSRISIKATTTEKMGFVGEGKGISAYAMVLVDNVL
ncbi:MAG: 2-C-methyl-D-erythritol 2,4-cyclodiphosphate synthase [Anaerophaga sp.]|uniref:2-C-methyl-D-erythritol 2,4-cyclodiphosphate synthase n=1 Tax=Anaerophaga thermohalophila TaxID=177400 RepID=UPI000237D3E2|nr:2-C-methyl-D-erythritol 2,4-cyclodiphosphate synthase [Anaerophaga thermohalophila]MDK2842521.1 2-C-methyl-D-erythritol 2,4-cyclodiphosphate synthase [Anaerophaga sp.]MDN5290196.1 2-C-methyl-D-erythritol 2,4-cyclodiphosphate synthase [Anaerophaga sp.]